jgi:hypothetical protein
MALLIVVHICIACGGSCALWPQERGLCIRHMKRGVMGLFLGLNNPAHERGFLKFNDNCTKSIGCFWKGRVISFKKKMKNLMKSVSWIDK